MVFFVFCTIFVDIPLAGIKPKIIKFFRNITRCDMKSNFGKTLLEIFRKNNEYCNKIMIGYIDYLDEYMNNVKNVKAIKRQYGYEFFTWSNIATETCQEILDDLSLLFKQFSDLNINENYFASSFILLEGTDILFKLAGTKYKHRKCRFTEDDDDYDDDDDDDDSDSTTGGFRNLNDAASETINTGIRSKSWDILSTFWKELHDHNEIVLYNTLYQFSIENSYCTLTNDMVLIVIGYCRGFIRECFICGEEEFAMKLNQLDDVMSQHSWKKSNKESDSKLEWVHDDCVGFCCECQEFHEKYNGFYQPHSEKFLCYDCSNDPDKEQTGCSICRKIRFKTDIVKCSTCGNSFCVRDCYGTTCQCNELLVCSQCVELHYAQDAESDQPDSVSSLTEGRW